jgi:hypothetical protein
MALSTKDPAAFQRGLQGGLEAHKKQYRRLPGDPRGFVSIGGMSLCRLAFDRGLTIEDQPYLPVRLLSNYRGAAVH